MRVAALFCLIPLFLLSAKEVMPTIHNLFSAGEYEEAAVKIGDVPADAYWKKQVVAYNLATVALMEGDNEKAINLLRDILPKTSPYLEQKVLVNGAIALWRDVQKLLLIDTYPAYKEAVRQLRGALELLREVDLQKYPNAKELKQVIKPELADLLHSRFERLKDGEHEREGVFLLLVGLNRLIGQIRFMEETPLDSENEASYQKLYYQQQKSWIPLLEFLSEKDRSFVFAKKIFQQALSAFEKGFFSEALSLLKSLEEKLYPALEKLLGGGGGLELLAQISGKYERALEQEVLSTSSFMEILREEEILQRALPGLGESLKFLKDGIALLDKSSSVARVYFLRSWQTVRDMLYSSMKNTPKESLEWLIEDQQLVLEMGNLAWVDGEEAVVQLLEEGELQVVQRARRYFEQVYRWQANQYSTECLCIPWDEVLPLFEKGRLAANQALEELKKGFSSTAVALAWERQAIYYWELAQEKLEKKKQVEKTEEKSSSAAPQVDEVLHLLQQMQQNDKGRDKPVQPVQGVKPW